MDPSTLSQDIQDLSLDLLLANSTSTGSNSIADALQKLSHIVRRAEEAGVPAVAESGTRLIASVDAIRNTTPPQDVLPLLMAGLKSLDESASRESKDIPAQAARESADANALGQDPELLQDFVLEAREHLSVVETQLLALEENPEDQESTHACFRAIHTIKGVAGFLELSAIREVAHEGETLLDEVRNGRVKVSAAVIDALLQAADFLNQEVSAVEAFLAGTPRKGNPDFKSLLETLRNIRSAPVPASIPKPPEPPKTPVEAPKSTKEANKKNSRKPPASQPDPVSETVGVAVSKPEEQPEQPSQVKPAAVPEKTEPPSSPESTTKSSASAAPKAPARDAKANVAAAARSVKVDMEKLDYLADMVGELVVTQSMLRLEGSTKGIAADSPLTRSLTQLARITAEVQKTTMSMRMVPIGQTFQRLARLVRDVSRQVGKSVELEISGEEIELDRSMVEELADPLMHMVRNSIDHGIETPEQRKQAGKKPVGRISLKARHDAGQVHIEISDDGRGLDRAKILAKARERGLVEANANVSENEILNLIFEPGFSTAEKVTDLSGRGVGMDVVRKQIQKLRGRVDLQSTAGKGTIFNLRLPLTLAIIDGLVIRVGAERFILPIASVKEVIKPTAEMIFTVEARGEMAMIRERLLPISRLHRRLNVQPSSEDLAKGILIIVEGQIRTYCLAVDELLGKQEVVIKSLGALMQNVPGIAGGAILGDGHVALILDPDAMASGRSERD